MNKLKAVVLAGAVIASVVPALAKDTAPAAQRSGIIQCGTNKECLDRCTQGFKILIPICLRTQSEKSE